ncbi:MAG TPA: START domain-containing protein [Deltaproteobacteria bacterium]|jgi:hypothetical protein|nr:START domain-containing protein [Deltaproteobacteria bacterium]HOI07523.1 START domain-containing protein [Deltaproteobacteria bacterium]
MKNAWLLVGILMLAQTAVAGPLEEGWTLSKQGEGITVYTRPIPGLPMKEFMGEGDVDAPLAVVQQVFLDFPSYTQWYGMCKEFRLLKTLNDKPNHYIVYYVLSSPWPVKDRDMVLDIQTEDLSREGKVILNIKAIPDELVPVSKKYVRMTRLIGKTTMTKVNDTKTHVVLTINSDPAGSVPIKLSDMVAKNQPFKTIQGLREMVKKDIYYQKAGVEK